MTSGKPDRSPTRLPGWAARAMAGVYGAAVARRNRRFDRGIGVTRLDRPVVSVGNLSAGGTGKTPMVRWAVETLASAGHWPAVAMRGYKAPPGGPSDEEREHREALPGVPVVARPDRAAGLRALFETPDGAGVDCVVLDDGFQHRRLARDLDLLLVDASRPPDRDALLPLGYLREPMGSLRRAGGVVITHAEMVSEDELHRLTRLLEARTPPGTPIGATEHAWTGLTEPGGRSLDTGWLRGRAVVGVCAIGNPEGFLASLDAAGARQTGTLVLPDHDPFAPTTRRRLDELAGRPGVEAVVMTRKDLAKLGDWAAARIRAAGSGRGPTVVVPTLALRWRFKEEAVRERVLGAVRGAGPARTVSPPASG